MSNTEHSIMKKENNMRRLEKKTHIIIKMNTKYLHDELISILFKSIETAKKNNAQQTK